MNQIPTTLEEAIAQAQQATLAAINDGMRRLQVELVIPELKIMPVAEQFLPVLEELDDQRLRVYFPDAGAAALARRDWGEKPYEIRGIKDLKAAIQPDETVFLFVEPSSVEVQDVEALCDQIGDRTTVFLNPHMEDVATIGIGYAGRQLRERFLNTFDSCYYIRAIEGAALFRCYPSPWQLWLEKEEGYEKLTDFPSRPSGEQLDQAMMGEDAEESPDSTSSSSKPAKRKGVLAELQQFLRALSQ
ncbi:MAG: DUF1995 family protein [Leptolyngbyaceae bacterium]|nr:DUF1995 family protein [Leptolyngbyaceae bacterium]